MKLVPIAHLKSCFKNKFATPRQSGLAPHAWAKLELSNEIRGQGLLDGIERFSHLWLIGLFHLNTNKNPRGKVRPPRFNGAKIGSLASRSPHRPNPLSLTVVQVSEVGDNFLIVHGADLVDGTPILDIKPYIPQYDSLPDARAELPVIAKRYPVRFTEAFVRGLNGRQLPLPAEQFQNLITECVQDDPRPQVYRKLQRSYAFQLFDWDVKFEFNDGEFLITELCEPSTVAANLSKRPKAQSTAPAE